SCCGREPDGEAPRATVQVGAARREPDGEAPRATVQRKKKARKRVVVAAGAATSVSIR
ncbi:hypothetical protein JFN88_11175, partial [Paenibacillus sp. MAHUQ-46]|nr:hypothetical protein [Paenibacillus roseus]